MASPSMSISTPPDRDTAPVASVRGVSHTYGSARAVDALDLDIPAGCMVGLIGPDGVGKSTLMGLIAGAKKIQVGSVRVLDGDMAEAAHRDERDAAQVVPVGRDEVLQPGVVGRGQLGPQQCTDESGPA